MADNKKFKPKYIAKIPLGKDTYRYFYTKSEYQAYLKSKLNKTTSSISTTLKNVGDKTTSIIKSRNVSQKEKSKFLSDGKTSVSKLLRKTNGVISIDKSARDMPSVIKNITTNISENIKSGEKVASKTVEKTKDVSSKEVSGLSESGKKAIAWLIGGRIGVGIYNAVNNHVQKVKRKETDEYKEYTKEFLDSEAPSSFAELKPINPQTTDDEDQATINEWYEYSIECKDSTATQNCSYCTAAYDLRQRGYDVEAGPWTSTDPVTTYSEIASWYDGEEAHYKEYDSRSSKLMASKIEDELVSQGDGARGHFMLYWENGGGHDVIYEVKDNNVVLRDCQTNQTLALNDYMQYANGVIYFRTDNIEPNDKVLKKVRHNDD